MSVMIPRSRVAIALAAVALVYGCANAPPAQVLPMPVAANGPAPHLILARSGALLESRRRLAAGDAMLRPALDALILSADSAMHAGPWTVMAKKHLPPNGDRHDFMSLAPYWWPDTAKPGGLPYVRRDGEMNPESRTDHDGLRFQAMAHAVQSLALAYWFTGRASYADRAALDLRTWFVDTATRMNPNLRYAQAVLGVNDGRGIGIIDLRDVPSLLDAVRLLETSGSWPASDRATLDAWCRDYLDWLKNSRNGKDERDADNNHGTWYDAQVAALALFVGDTATAREAIATRAEQRIATQIRPDGSQPLELARTRPLHYSLFNLDAFTQLAEMGRHIGVDLWNYQPPGSGGLVSALRFIAPYADSAKPWPTPQVTPATPDDFLAAYSRSAFATADPVITAAFAALPTALTSPSTFALLYPPNDGPRRAASDSVLDAALRWAGHQMRISATALDPANGYPRSTRADGSWEQQSYRQWTSGFFAGTLWYLYQDSHDSAWRALAEKWTDGLEPAKTMAGTHDLGFMIFDSFGHGYLLTGNEHYRDVVMTASRTLATRFNPAVGAIKSWDLEGATDQRRGWKYPVIVDNLMNLEMLFWAGSHGGDSAWTRIATSHALVSARAHVRPDGSTAHIALFDPATGALERTVTWQGYSDSSAWARGQAWAIHGLSAAYGDARRPELLAAATRVADFFIAHLPADGVPYWDFRDPSVPDAPRDASAAAIAASGLLDLARHVDAADAVRYREAAMHILHTLSTSYLTKGTNSAAILQHSVGGKPQNSEVDVGIVYADYFFVEALMRAKHPEWLQYGDER
jgi:unsaturated chondroitin disaccharide hydrolase